MLKDTEMHEASRGISETAEQLLVGYYTILSLLLPATTQNWFKTNDANTNNNIKLYHDDNSDQQWRTQNDWNVQCPMKILVGLNFWILGFCYLNILFIFKM